MTDYNKSVKIALGKAIKTDVLRSGFIIPLRKWPKEVCYSIEIPGTF
jgi:hypothetical protein